MFEFGDEHELTIIDSFNSINSWLISIQLFAMLLLFILLYHLTLTTSDHLSTATAPPPATARPSITSADANNRHNSQARENEIKETRSGEVVQRGKKPDAQQRAEPSTTNDGSDMMFQHSHHPCHFFGFAKQAFLKCLGIDTTCERPHEKDD